MINFNARNVCRDGFCRPDDEAGEERQGCSNPHCLDGYVDKKFGTQDGRYSWVDQVPCQVCNSDDEENNND